MSRSAPALLIIAAACSPPPEGAPQTAATPEAARSAFAADTGVIFAGDRALELTEQCSRVSPGPVEGTWTPSADEIAALEPGLTALVRARLQTQWPNEAIAVETYHRQYGGLIIGGRRIIYVHGFRPFVDDPDEGWRTWPMMICDGGPITFGVEYDPVTQEFTNFAFNGLA